MTATAQPAKALDPGRDYMQDPDVATVGDALAKIAEEMWDEYRAAGMPLGGDLGSMRRWHGWSA